MVNSKFAQSSFLFILATILLKMTGLIRDIIIAFYFGDSYQADAYLAAFVFLNMFFLFYATGMKNTFIPSYLTAVERKQGEQLFVSVYKMTIILGVLLTVLGLVVLPKVLPILYANFHVQQLDLTINLAKIFTMALLFVAINSVLEAHLDARSKYTISIIAQIIVLVTTIASAFLFANVIGTFALAYGYLFGSMFSFLFKIFFFVPQKLYQKHSLNFFVAKQFYLAFIPIAITVMVGQINLSIDHIFASNFGEGAVTYINYAKNLVHFPQAIFGVTIGTIFFPIIAKSYAKGEMSGFIQSINQALLTMFYILLPAIAGMLFLMPSIISIIYQRGAFTEQATIATSQIAYLYAGSVFFFSMNIVINNALYTLKQGRKVMFVSLFSVILNYACNEIFINWIGYLGIPIASSFVGLFFATTCYLLFKKEVGAILDKHFFIQSAKTLLATIVMLGTLIVTNLILVKSTASLQLMSSILTGVTSYFIVSYILKIQSFFTLFHNVKKMLGLIKC